MLPLQDLVWIPTIMVIAALRTSVTDLSKLINNRRECCRRHLHFKIRGAQELAADYDTVRCTCVDGATKKRN